MDTIFSLFLECSTVRYTRISLRLVLNFKLHARERPTAINYHFSVSYIAIVIVRSSRSENISKSLDFVTNRREISRYLIRGLDSNAGKFSKSRLENQKFIRWKRIERIQ